MDPVTVSFETYKDSLKTTTDVIGYDWKTLVGTSWSLDQDKVFFVKTADQKVWELRLIDFEVSATGTAVIEKTDITASSSDDLPGISTVVYPNPATDRLYVVTDQYGRTGSRVQVTVHNLAGLPVYSSKYDVKDGMKAHTIETSSWAGGIYFVTLTDEKGNRAVRKINKL